jgi:Predicted membrane protein (DUF2306)
MKAIGFPRSRIALLFALSLGIVAYAAISYTVLPLGALVNPEMQATFRAHPLGIYTHIAGAIFALALGPLQFSARLRARRIALHRWIGRTYLVGVAIGGLAGLYMAFFAYGGPIARVGFAALAIGWLYTGVEGYGAIRRRAVAEHRAWMVRNFALTFAAVTLRMYLPLSAVAGIDFDVAYPAIAWLCWVPNLLVAEWLFNAQAGKRAAPDSSGSRSAFVK